MADLKNFNLFGFRIRKKAEETKEIKTFVQPSADDGSVTISSSAFFGSAAIDVEGVAKNDVELITRYREMSMQAEIESAIEDIVNEAIVCDDDDKNIKLNLDDLKQPDKIKKAIFDEFENIQRLLNYNNLATDIFRRYYVDGRLFYQVIIDTANPQKGILELRYIDPRKIKKIKQIRKVKDPTTGVDMIDNVEEFYIYNDRVQVSNQSQIGVKIAVDSVINVNSGLMDPKRSMVLSYLHKAIKPLNQLRMIEDASVIYKISRAPQRRVFYIDVGNLPKVKAEQYVRDIMTKYKNKITYDAQTGEVRDDRRHLSMLEDFWFPRRENGKTTEVTTLQSTDNFNDMSMVEYFEKKLYKSLNVPVTRLDPSQAVSIGRSMEITRDELKFSKFVNKLRKKFSDIFYQALRVQLILKGVCTDEEWQQFKENIFFDFTTDNNFVELKESELMTERLNILAVIDPFVDKYYSKPWIQKNILRLNDEEIKEMESEMEEGRKEAFELQTKDSDNQIQLQARSMQLQTKLGLLPQQPESIDAGADQASGAESAKPSGKNNPYNV